MILGVSTKPDRAQDRQEQEPAPQDIEWSDITPHPPGDQVDRSVVLGHGIKQAATWALSLVHSFTFWAGSSVASGLAYCRLHLH